MPYQLGRRTNYRIVCLCLGSWNWNAPFELALARAVPTGKHYSINLPVLPNWLKFS